MLRDDDFDHTDLGDAFGDLRCPDSEAKTLSGPLKETLKKDGKTSPKEGSSWIHFKMVDLSGPFFVRTLQDGNQAFQHVFREGIDF